MLAVNVLNEDGAGDVDNRAKMKTRKLLEAFSISFDQLVCAFASI